MLRCFDFSAMGIGPKDEVYFQYKVHFRRGYQFSHGDNAGHGKLPGCAGTIGIRPFDVGGGGKRWADAWSSRMIFGRRRECYAYLYVPSPVAHNYPYGWARRFDAVDGSPLTFVDGWNVVEVHYRMNTPGVSDGWLRCWMNNHLGVDYRGVQYRDRDHPTLRVSQIACQWFYGGPESDFPPKREQIEFADFKLSSERIG